MFLKFFENFLSSKLWRQFFNLFSLWAVIIQLNSDTYFYSDHQQFKHVSGTTGSGVGHWVQVAQPINLLEGYNDVALLSLTVGLQVCLILSLCGHVLAELILWMLICFMLLFCCRIMVPTWRKTVVVSGAKSSLQDWRMETWIYQNYPGLTRQFSISLMFSTVLSGTVWVFDYEKYFFGLCVRGSLAVSQTFHWIHNLFLFSSFSCKWPWEVQICTSYKSFLCCIISVMYHLHPKL